MDLLQKNVDLFTTIWQNYWGGHGPPVPPRSYLPEILELMTLTGIGLTNENLKQNNRMNISPYIEASSLGGISFYKESWGTDMSMFLVTVERQSSEHYNPHQKCVVRQYQFN